MTNRWESARESCDKVLVDKLHIEQNRLVIARDHPPRKDWRKSFAAASSLIDEDQLFVDAMPQNAFDAEEWTW